MNEESNQQSSEKSSYEYSRYRNAARAAPLSGRIHPLKYTSPLDTKDLMTAEEFRQKKIRGKPGNRYTDGGDIIEIHTPTGTGSPQTATTARSETLLSGTTERSDTARSPIKYKGNEDFAPHGW
jgi:hypothetical protein